VSTEPVAHRCVKQPEDGEGAVTLSNLPPGTYSITIADDYSSDWLGENGLTESSFCEGGFAAGGNVKTDSFSVSTPPVSTPPSHETPSTLPPTTPSSTQSPSTPTTTPTTAQSPCPRGAVAARIGGQHKCLHAGLACVSRYQRQYHAHGFTCARSGRRERLRRLRR
jgi:hypothetical protein